MALAVIAACGGDSLPTPLRLDLPSSEVVDSFGRLSDERGIETFSWVRQAELSPSGRFLAVANGSPPFLRVFDRIDGSAWAFGREGQGPGELRGVWGLTFHGDSLVLVLSGQRIESYTVLGEWRGGWRVTDRGIRAMSVAAACGGRVFVYGVPFPHRGLDSVPWLHEMTLSSSAPSEAVLTVPGRAGGSVRFGALFGIDGNTEGVLVWHQQIQSGLEAGYWVPCDGSPSLLDRTATEVPLEEAFMVGSRKVLITTLGDTLFGGAAARGNEGVRAFRWEDEGVEITSLRTMKHDACSVLEIMGHWTIHDASADLLVLARQEPVPVVRLVRWGWIEANSTERPCIT